MSRKKTWKTYNTWPYDSDPKRDAVCRLMEGQSNGVVSRVTGVAPSTYSSWRSKKTRRPTGMLMDMTAFALGAIAYDLVNHEFIMGKRAKVVPIRDRKRA